MDARQHVIHLLERALESARTGVELAELGPLIARASEAAGTPSSVVQLARSVRAKGFGLEADLVGLAIDVASAAEAGGGEDYERGLINLHDLACERLDEIHDARHHRPPKAGARTDSTSRLN